MTNTVVNISVFLILSLAIIGTAFVALRYYFQNKGRLHRSINLDLLLIRVPKETPKGEETITRELEREWTAVMEQLLSTIANIREKNYWQRLMYPPLSIVFEMATVDGMINFYVAVPKRYTNIIEKQIHGFYSHAEIEKVEDYNIFNPGGEWAIAYAKLKQPNYLPVKTYMKLESDPLNDSTNALSKINAQSVSSGTLSFSSEGAAIQLILTPARQDWQKQGQELAQKMKEGFTLSEARKQINEGFFSALGKMFAGAGKELVASQNKEAMDPYQRQQQEEEKLKHQTTYMEDEMAKSVEEKASKNGFMVNVRLVASANDKNRADNILESMQNIFEQYEDPNLNSFEIKKGKQKDIKNYIFRNYDSTKSVLLNTEEITSLYHFPIATNDTPNINILKAKKSHPPANLPKEGIKLGYTFYRGEKVSVRMTPEDRRRHLYIIGQTGTGKSVNMKDLAIQDILNGEGVAYIDPHGSAIEDILMCIPKERMEDVIYFDAGDIERPMGMNILEYHSEEDKDFITQEMIQIFYKLVSDPAMIGPIFEHQMRNVMLTLMADPDQMGTIVEIPRMFTDDKYQKEKLVHVKDPMVRNFWEQEMAKTNDFHKSEQLGYIISKVGRFVENEMLRNIIGQQKSAFDFKEVMDNKKILLANLSKGKTGEINSKLLGLILVSKMQMAALDRQRMIEKGEDFPDFYLYIDEFQNYITDSINVILSEARKYKLCLNMAHQFIAQLGGGQDKAGGNQATVKDAVFGNVGSMVIYRVGSEDAEFLEKYFSPEFAQQDLSNIDNHNAHIRMIIDGMVTKPFNMVGYPPIEKEIGSVDVANYVKELSRMKYGVNRNDIVKEIGERANLQQATNQDPAVADPFSKL